MNKLFTFLLLAVAGVSGASAQSYGRYQTCSLSTQQGQAIAGAQVYFLTQPANTTALTPLATVYGSSTGGVVTNPVPTNQQGTCAAYLTPGSYTVCYKSQYTGVICQTDQIITSPTGGGSGITQLTGAVTAGPGSGSKVATITPVISPGTCGDSTHYPTVVYNAAGQITGCTAQSIPASGINQLTGDVTAGPGSGSQATTLATVNSSPGTCGDSTHVCQVTTNGKGLTTGQSAVAITGGGG
jgi:hypothetical protein